MATEPRRSLDPDETFSEVAANFEKLADTIQHSIEQTEAQTGQEDALSHLKSAHRAAVRGARLAKRR